jgi:hypothetical protein
MTERVPQAEDYLTLEGLNLGSGERVSDHLGTLPHWQYLRFLARKIQLALRVRLKALELSPDLKGTLSEILT